MIESSEKTRSITAIWVTASKKLWATLTSWLSSTPSTEEWISTVAFHSRNRPPASRIRSRHENAKSPIMAIGWVSPMIHTMLDKSATRIKSAMASPIMRTRRR